MYFMTVAYHAYRASHDLAVERGTRFGGFERSAYAKPAGAGNYFDKYTNGERPLAPKTGKVASLFAQRGIHIPDEDDWRRLRDDIMRDGIFNQYLQAVPPTGSISYINHSTSSIHPIASKIEIRKEGKIGRIYYPAPYMTNDNLQYFADAYEIGWKAIVDTYAEATRHVDQGLSLTLFFPRYGDYPRFEQGADLCVAQRHQNAVLHPHSSAGVVWHRSARLRQLHVVKLLA